MYFNVCYVLLHKKLNSLLREKFQTLIFLLLCFHLILYETESVEYMKNCMHAIQPKDILLTAQCVKFRTTSMAPYETFIPQRVNLLNIQLDPLTASASNH